VPTIGQLAASKPAPWRDLALALFVVAAGLLLAGFQLSIGSLSSDDLSLWIRGPLTVAGVAALTVGLIVLVKNAPGVNQWVLIWVAIAILFPLGCSARSR
jgi:hypothetical protein